VSTDAVGPLAAGASSNESFAYSYTCSAPGDSVAVQADKDNVVVESNEGNNSLTKSWSCFIIILTPDLIITDVSRDGSTIKYTIKNQGSAPSGVSVTQLLVDGAPVATDSVPGLAAGASSNQSFAAYSYSCSGVSDIVQVRADKDNVVTESNEANNTLSENFGCLILILYPDLIITDITRSGNTIFYKIKNQGVVASGATTSRLVVDGAIKANDGVASLSAGEERTESFAFVYSCTAPGDTIQVTADIFNAVNEGSSEGNNSRSENYFCP
jgi:subtilase family serine protease